MPNDIIPRTTRVLADLRKQPAPDIHDAFATCSEPVPAAGALPIKSKQLIAVAVAQVTRCS
jgi:alkylhydroperoxidase/carboxymuconolactone decarboxylase family protein YurZ